MADLTFNANNETFNIQLNSGSVCIDSRVAAKGLGLSHKVFKETVRKYEADLLEFGIMPFETAKPQNADAGRPETYYLLNRAQVTFIASRSRSTPEVVSFLKAYIKKSEELETLCISQAALMAEYKQQGQRLIARVELLAASGEPLDADLMREMLRLADLNKKAAVLKRTGIEATRSQLASARTKAAEDIRTIYLAHANRRVQMWVEEYSTQGDYQDVIETYLDYADLSERAEEEAKYQYATNLQYVQDLYVMVSVSHDDERALASSAKRIARKKTQYKQVLPPTPVEIEPTFRNDYDDMLDNLKF